jgi:NADH-quinone oxidoreductase subunit E
MGQAPVRVQSVVSFYTMFNMKPVGRHHIQVCRTLPCALRGAAQVTALLKQKLGIECGQTTADGRFTLSEVECLASCGTAPMMQVNDDYYENLTEAKIDEILGKLK